MASVFISYSRKDERLARQLAVALSNRGFEVWIDVEDIPAGMKWSRAIQQGLDSAEAMVVLISPDSMQSTNVEDEWQYFLDQKKPVIPALVREAKVHFQLARIQYIDFLRLEFDSAFLELVDELMRKGLVPGASVVRTPSMRPIAAPKMRSRAWIWGAGGVGLLALAILLLRPNGPLFPIGTPSATAGTAVLPSPSVPATDTATATLRPVFSPDELTATEQAAFELAFTQIAQTEIAQTVAANAPAATLQAQQTGTANAFTATANAFTDTPTPNRLQTIVAQRATQTRQAQGTATVLALTPSVMPTETCENALPPRLVIGQAGRVIDNGVPQRVRATPSTGAEIIASLDPGATFFVADGPLCGQGNGLMWWRITWEGGNGWTAESSDGEYFLEPLAP